MTSLAQRWCLTAALGLALTGCTESPRERLTSAWAAADEALFDAYVSHFTVDSVPLVRGLVETASRTKKAFKYVDSPYDLVPAGDILEIEERDQLALVTVKAKERYAVRMRLEGGTWAIDGTSLFALWAPLKGTDDG